MPKRFTGKLCGFLFDHLERGTFGDRLRWVDRAQGVFKILWRHGNGASATPEEDCAVFMEWHRHKTRRTECTALEAKQRFRAALNKMKLDVVKEWDRDVQEKNFQHRKFPKEDLEYLFKKGDQRVPASPALSIDYSSETESQPTSLHDVPCSGAYYEPTSPDSLRSTDSNVATSKPSSSAAASAEPDDSWQLQINHHFMPSLGCEAPYRALENDEQRVSPEEIDQMFYSFTDYNAAEGSSLCGLDHNDVPLLMDEMLSDDKTADEELDSPFVKEMLCMDEETLLSSFYNNAFQES
ncbi:hypothetical protein HPB50_000793 [Hyalomma asiaticum]|uniref:Uncharacterized protein n=1 Tax=Hyalomma asiaticum TaxID=266040 RepID=A0ACB7TA62_HYAAI|nr:hypothetical protein HPB50_000793 [Hyalomma asiaticum]